MGKDKQVMENGGHLCARRKGAIYGSLGDPCSFFVDGERVLCSECV
jgi:hypothetical protein